MKICILTQNIFTLGGVQQVVMNIGAHLQNVYKDDITIVMPEERGRCFKLPEDFQPRILSLESVFTRNQNICLRIIRKINRETGLLDHSRFVSLLDRLYYSEQEVRRLAEYLNGECFDWVIGTGCEYSLLVAKMSCYLNCRTMGWMHSTYQYYYRTKGREHYGREHLNKMYLPLMDRIFVLNKADEIAFGRFFDCSTDVMYNPVLDGCRQISGNRSTELIFAGRLDLRIKGLDHLMEIMEKVSKEISDCHLLIAGAGEGEKYLREQIEKRCLENNVELLGFRNDLPKLYASSRILLSTSRQEGFGMTIVEAMLCGTPCISFDNDGPRDIITSWEDGVLIPKYDTDRFAEAVVRLLKNPEEYARMSRKACARAQDFSVDRIAAEFREKLSEQ